jgi:hypothetical protein
MRTTDTIYNPGDCVTSTHRPTLVGVVEEAIQTCPVTRPFCPDTEMLTVTWEDGARWVAFPATSIQRYRNAA